MAVLAVVGAVIILAGLIICTDRVDNHWRNRNMQPEPKTVPPFIWSTTQCVGCGTDNELLNLDRRCIYCHERAHT